MSHCNVLACNFPQVPSSAVTFRTQSPTPPTPSTSVLVVSSLGAEAEDWVRSLLYQTCGRESEGSDFWAQTFALRPQKNTRVQRESEASEAVGGQT